MLWLSIPLYSLNGFETVTHKNGNGWFVSAKKVLLWNQNYTCIDRPFGVLQYRLSMEFKWIYQRLFNIFTRCHNTSVIVTCHNCFHLHCITCTRPQQVYVGMSLRLIVLEIFSWEIFEKIYFSYLYRFVSGREGRRRVNFAELWRVRISNCKLIYLKLDTKSNNLISNTFIWWAFTKICGLSLIISTIQIK